jgi:dTDP-4-amino-4,6-dideoxygalactose transaminase
MTELESWASKYVGRTYAIRTGTGTAALTAALRAVGVGAGDEVIVPSIVCYAVPFAVLYAGAMPRFCDVEEATLNLDVRALPTLVNKRTRGIVAVHLFGYPSRITEIEDFARAHSLWVVEDFAQGLGGCYQGRRLGSFGLASITSFGKQKIVDAGGGGLLLTNDVEMARSASAFINSLPVTPRTQIRALQALYALFFGLLRAADGDRVRWRKLAHELAGFFRMLFLLRLSQPQEQRIITGLQSLDENLDRRRKMVLYWRETLRETRLEHLNCDVQGGLALTHYTCILKNSPASELVSRWRPGKVNCLYPPMHQVFGSPDTLPVADALRGKLVNFPTDLDLSWQDLEALAQATLRRLNKANP